jgi:tRNA-dependent cyclodipeptide synthase
MILESCFNTTPQQIDAGRWNPYLGISINNKAFTSQYLFAYMDWAAERAKERAAIVVVDIIQHINNQVFDRSEPIAAIERALRKAGKVRDSCDEAKSKLHPDKSARIVILEWADLLCDSCFCGNLSVINEAFAKDRQFRDAMISVTQRNLGSITSRLDDDQLVMLTRYLLNELPELIAGFNHGGIHFNLNVYPGKIASICAELQELESFRRVCSRLQRIGETASVVAYLQQDPKPTEPAPGAFRTRAL